MPTRPRLAALAAALALSAFAPAAASAAQDANAASVREDLAQVVDPAGAPGWTLALTRVTIRPGTALALHTHPGTEVARILRGRLTYTVVTGSVPVYRGPADAPALVRRLTAGRTAVLRAGQWIVESPGEQHRAVNRGRRPVVILLASLFPTGAPTATPVAG
ncbi:MAG: hypothetical protein IRZ32_03560 [Solirubrobacteraceae bacterium]|nr:hypothetical protein [Solirubrobacteraceae bacterium]